MFEVGETVYVNGTKTKGTILEVDAGFAYIELTNGVEMEYNVSDLVSETEVVERLAKEREVAERLAEEREATAIQTISTQPATQKDRYAAKRSLKMIEEIFPDILYILPKEITDPVDRINELVVKTGTPAVVWLGGGENRDLLKAVLRKTMLHTALSSDSTLLMDMLLAKCKQVIEDYENEKD